MKNIAIDLQMALVMNLQAASTSTSTSTSTDDDFPLDLEVLQLTSDKSRAQAIMTLGQLYHRMAFSSSSPPKRKQQQHIRRISAGIFHRRESSDSITNIFTPSSRSSISGIDPGSLWTDTIPDKPISRRRMSAGNIMGRISATSTGARQLFTGQRHSTSKELDLEGSSSSRRGSYLPSPIAAELPEEIHNIDEDPEPTGLEMSGVLETEYEPQLSEIREQELSPDDWLMQNTAANNNNNNNNNNSEEPYNQWQQNPADEGEDNYRADSIISGQNDTVPKDEEEEEEDNVSRPQQTTSYKPESSSQYENPTSIPWPIITSSKRPYLPSEQNDYAGFCKGAWKLQLGLKKAFTIRSRPEKFKFTSLTLYWRCSKCNFEGGPVCNTTTTTTESIPTTNNNNNINRRRKSSTMYRLPFISSSSWPIDPSTTISSSSSSLTYTFDMSIHIHQPTGIKYRWTFLAKSHIPTKKTNTNNIMTRKKNQISNTNTESNTNTTTNTNNYNYTYACIFCTAKNHTTPAPNFPNLNIFMNHLYNSHRYMHCDRLSYPFPQIEVLLDRARCVVGRVANDFEDFDVNIPPTSPSSGLG